MKRKLLITATVLVAAALTGCETPRYVGIGPYGVDGYKDGMTVVRDAGGSYIVTSPPPAPTRISVRTGGGDSYRYGSDSQRGSRNWKGWLR